LSVPEPVPTKVAVAPLVQVTVTLVETGVRSGRGAVVVGVVVAGGLVVGVGVGMTGELVVGVVVTGGVVVGEVVDGLVVGVVVGELDEGGEVVDGLVVFEVDGVVVCGVWSVVRR